MPMFEMKPTIVEAHQIPAVNEHINDAFMEFLRAAGNRIERYNTLAFTVHTDDGRMVASTGDWITVNDMKQYRVYTDTTFRKVFSEIAIYGG